MKFNHYIAQRLPELQWRHFGVGALQAYLFEGPGYEQRIHVWHHSLVAEGIRGSGDMHNHRFSFKSDVLCGAIDNRECDVTPDDSGDADVYLVVNAREQKALTGSFDGNVWFSHRANVRWRAPKVTVDGSSYEFSRGDFHVTLPLGTTVTLVTKYDVQEGRRAEIVVPHGATLVHAFDESRAPDVAGVIAEAVSALIRSRS